MNPFQIIFYISLALYVLWVLSFVFLERRRENSLISWLLVFIAFPFIGFAIYLIFGRDMSKRKVFRLYKAEEHLMDEIKARGLDDFESRRKDLRRALKERMDILDLTSTLSPTAVSFDNQVEIFTSGKEKFDSLIRDIEEAKGEIHLLTFIYQNDDLGRKIRDLLVRRAKEGIVVRVLLDHFGSFNVRGKFFDPLRRAGGKVAFSFPLRPWNLQINNRNHRKLVIIDNRIAYIGGFNIGDEYLGLHERWRDTHLRIQGSSVLDLQIRFFLDWRNAGNNDLGITLDRFKEPAIRGDIPIQILSSGPDSVLEEIKLTYLDMINKARETIYMQTPYFVPDEAMFEALRIALIKGIDVRIMIPNRQDHAFVYWATYSFIGDLLPLGLKAYTYEKGFLHGKTMVVDGKIASVGSANFDKRSFRLSFECNAFLFGNKVCGQMRDLFMKDLGDCRELTKEIYDQRSWIVRMKEPISRIISPIL